MTDAETAADFFALFSLDRRFDIDSGSLQSAYLELARRTHPDFAGADPEAQLRAMELSAQVNEAYRVLCDPELRAHYLLQLLGTAPDNTLPDGFLEQIMDWREQLADAQGNHDKQKIRQLESQAKAQREIHLQCIAELFKTTGEADRATIRHELNALRYIQRLLEQIH
jgi:molecular chaperone HscB